MKCKIRITCKKCGCSFEVEAKTFHGTGNLYCLNCGQEMLRRDWMTLANGLEAISDVPSETDLSENEPGVFSDYEGFHLEVIGSGTSTDGE